MPKLIVIQTARSFRLEVVVAASIVFMSIVQPVAAPFWTNFEQSRMWRDFTGLTPFRDVRIEVVNVADGSLAVMGTMIKQRDCEIVERSVWVRDSNNVLRLAKFESGPVPGMPPAKRFVSEDRQAFGPIIVTPEGDFTPIGAVYFATHDCWEDVLDADGQPTGQQYLKRQSNIFFDVEWRNYP